MLLSMVFTRAPEVESFAFGIIGLSVDATLTVLAKLEGLHNIALRPNRADTKAFRILSALPELRTVAFDRIAVRGPPERPFSGFHTLQSLTIMEHPDSVHFYEFFSSPGLTKLEIYEYPATLSIKVGCDLWTRRFPSLQHIRCQFEEQEILRKNQRRYPISRVIKPLFAIPTITRVSLTFPNTQYVIVDADILEITTAWLRLAELGLHLRYSKLGVSPPSMTPSAPGIASLILPAMHCPLLRSLDLPRLEVPDSLVAQIDEIPILDHSLESLSLYMVEVDDVASCAVVIDRLFPHLTIPSVQARKHLAQDVKDLWSMIWACQMARRQQEQRARQAMRQRVVAPSA